VLFFKDKILKNISWLFLGQAVVKVIAFSYTIFLARTLGVSNFGLYVYVLTTFTLVSSLADLGFNRFLIRDLAKDKNDVTKYLSNVLPLRFILNFVVVVLVSAVLFLFDKDPLRTKLAVLGLFSIIFNGSALTFDSIFVSQEQMRLSALASVIFNFSIATIGIFLIAVLKISTLGAVLALVLGHLAYLVVGLVLILKMNFIPRLSFDFGFWKKAVLGSLPYGVLAVLGLIYLRIDAVILTFLKGEQSTGYYGVAFKFLDGINFIPVVVSTAIFPSMARLHDQSINKLKSVYFRAVLGLLMVSLAVTAILFLFAPFLISILYGQTYSPSILALKILAFTAIFSFIQVPTAHLLFATDKYLKEVIFLSLFGVFLNVILNFALIPKFDFYGSSFATVVTEAVSFVLFFNLIVFKIFKNKEQN
jgi:O-antigen/teichoic acid export membrane protein